MRRSRAEQLILVGTDGTPVVLAAESREPGELATQDVFQVAGDGAHLAYAFEGRLHVRAAEGDEHVIAGYGARSQMRFSPDGARVAAVIGDQRTHVVVMDVATGDVRDVATLPAAVRQLEWAGDRLVALSGYALVALPFDRPPVTLMVETGLQRFAASASRVVLFDNASNQTHVLALDPAAPQSLHELTAIEDDVTNAALSLDGARLAFTTQHAVFEGSADDKPTAISDRENVHSLWFSRDGRLGYASSAGVTVLGGDHPQRFDSDGEIEMLRFDARSNEWLVATATHAWDAGKRLASPPPGQRMLGVDRFAGGVVMWTAL